jgi:hypothetical protein
MKRTALPNGNADVRAEGRANATSLPSFWRRLHIGVSAQWWNHDQVFGEDFRQLGEAASRSFLPAADDLISQACFTIGTGGTFLETPG